MISSYQRRLGRLAMAVLVWPACAEAQTPARSFGDLIGILKPNTTIAITDTGGHRVKGTLVAIDENALSLSTEGRSQVFPKQAIMTVRLTDGVGDGALIGAGAGLGAALGLLGTLGSRDGYVLPSAKVGAPLLLSGIGAIVGALIDRGREGDRLLYASPSSLAQP
jgi:hypothetical protein